MSSMRRLRSPAKGLKAANFGRPGSPPAMTAPRPLMPFDCLAGSVSSVPLTCHSAQESCRTAAFRFDEWEISTHGRLSECVRNSCGFPGEPRYFIWDRARAPGRLAGRLYAVRCDSRKLRTWRTASGIFSGVSFHGYMLSWPLGASIALSIATAYECPGVSSGNTNTGV